MKICHCLIAILCLAAPAMASIIKKPPVKTEEPAYKDLSCTEEQKAFIYEIISTMGEYGKASLFFKQGHLKELGARISDVHPMKFMSTIFTNDYLRTCMPGIWDDYFKRTNLMGGLGPSLTREMEKGKLLSHLKNFAEELAVPEELIRPYFEAQDWENLVLFLIQYDRNNFS